MKQLAIIGSTASGKSDLALALASAYNGLIFSIDSLSIYREIDIASAKPSPEELSSVPHFGVDLLQPDQTASVLTFIHEYKTARSHAHEQNKNLIIVGGSSFYLKTLLEGLSTIPEISPEVRDEAALMMEDPAQAHHILSSVDPATMARIQPSDRYRIEKMLHLYLQTRTPPSLWFTSHPPVPVIEHCEILDLKIERSVLRERILLRTKKMVGSGLIDEVAQLEWRYGRSPNSMKAIGIIETLDYLDGKISKEELIEEIATHTSQLAKRQQTFNAHQFTQSVCGSADQLYKTAQKLLS